jgi:hypothetical protein
MRSFAGLAAFIITAISLTAAAPIPLAEPNARQLFEAAPETTLQRKSKIAFNAAANKSGIEAEAIAIADAVADTVALAPEMILDEKRQLPGGFPTIPGFAGFPGKGAAPGIPGFGGAGGGFKFPSIPGLPGKGAAHPSASAAASATRAATPAPSAGAKRQLTDALLSNGGFLGGLGV